MSATFCMGCAYLFRAPTVLLRKVHDVFWGLLIPSVLYFLVLGFRPKISVFMTTGDVEPKRSTDSLLLSEAR